jgi:predicted permease
VGTVWHDLRYAARALAKSPGFTGVAVLTLALGLGANSAIFGLVNAILLRPLAYREPDRLVLVQGSNPQKGFEVDRVSYPELLTWRERSSVLDFEPSTDRQYNLTGSGEPELIFGYRFSAGFLPLLGVEPILGRTFLPEEDRPGAPHVVLLSHSLWQRRFASDARAIGKPIVLNGEPYEIVGVMPPGFRYPETCELWTPLALDASAAGARDFRFLNVMGRLRPGVTREQAQHQMDAIAALLEQQYPETNAGQRVRVVGLRENATADVRAPLLVLLVSVGLVLLIACTNIAGLLLARGSARRREVAIRQALGASRLRLVRQLVTEGLLLSTLGGALGFVLALIGAERLLTLLPQNIENLSIPKLDAIPFDLRVIGFSVVVAVFTGVMASLLPAVQASRSDVTGALKDEGRSSTGSTGVRRFERGLVVAETALALVLLVAAGLTIKSFLRLQQGDLGLDPRRVLTAQVLLPQYAYATRPKRVEFVEAVSERLAALPGVESMGTINWLPLSGFWNSQSFEIEGRSAPKPGDAPEADDRIVTPGYFRTMGIRLVQGRDFTERDHESAPQVAIVNETLARRYWPDGDALGRRLNLGDAAQPSWWEIVGVVGDVKAFGLESRTHNDVYRPYRQVTFPVIAFVMRTTLEPESLVHALRQELRAVDPNQPLFKVLSMERLAAESITLRRVSMVLIGSFAAMALLLAALGVYGVLSHAVGRRTHEIGVRLALGARQSAVFWRVVLEGMTLAALGVGIGVLASLALTRYLTSLLFGVEPSDPATFAAVVVVLGLVALLACWIPARRATRIDPLVALRYE